MDERDDSKEQDLFTGRSASSSKDPPKTPTSTLPRAPSRDGAYRSGIGEESSTSSETRDAALCHELESLRKMNAAVVAVSNSLDKAQANMNTISQTVTHATALLDTWTRILAQTEQNQRLILNPSWEGASKDIADAEREALRRKREKEHKDAEEAQRRQAVEQRKRQQEEDQRRRAETAAAAASAPPTTPGSKSRRGVGYGGNRGTRGLSRGAAAGAGTSGLGAQRGVSTSSSFTSVSGSNSSNLVRGTGRAATAGYGRLGAVGTKNAPGRGVRGRGVG